MIMSLKILKNFKKTIILKFSSSIKKAIYIIILNCIQNEFKKYNS